MSLNEIVIIIEGVFVRKLKVTNLSNRSVDVPVSVLDIKSYAKIKSAHHILSICEVIKKTVKYYQSIV